MSRLSSNPITAYYQGCYDECRKLLTSPRFNRPQREVIEDEAWLLKEELESRGAKFEVERRSNVVPIPRREESA